MVPKFRAWDKKYKMIMTVNEIDFEKNTVWLEADNGDHENRHTLTRDFNDVVLMQSTGFKDNSDTEVFEGDVINVHWFYADFDPVELGAFENEVYAERVVVAKEFGNLGFWWKEADTWVDLATLAMSARLDEESFEILGNIYENPELLS